MRLLFGLVLLALVIVACEKEPLVYDYTDMLGIWTLQDEAEITLTIISVDPINATFQEFEQPDPYLEEAHTQDSTLYLTYKREFYQEDPDIHWTLWVEFECRVVTPTTMAAKVMPGSDYHDGRGIQWMESRDWILIKQ